MRKGAEGLPGRRGKTRKGKGGPTVPMALRPSSEAQSCKAQRPSRPPELPVWRAIGTQLLLHITSYGDHV